MIPGSKAATIVVAEPSETVLQFSAGSGTTFPCEILCDVRLDPARVQAVREDAPGAELFSQRDRKEHVCCLGPAVGFPLVVRCAVLDAIFFSGFVMIPRAISEKNNNGAFNTNEVQVCQECPHIIEPTSKL
jgi:hypothetical protein